jgi:hypothetical protein
MGVKLNCSYKIFLKNDLGVPLSGRAALCPFLVGRPSSARLHFVAVFTSLRWRKNRAKEH